MAVDNSGFPTEEEIINYGEGNCGQYCDLLARALDRKGIKCEIIGITSNNIGSITADHSIVEVETTEGKKFLIQHMADII